MAVPRTAQDAHRLTGAKYSLKGETLFFTKSRPIFQAKLKQVGLEKGNVVNKTFFEIYKYGIGILSAIKQAGLEDEKLSPIGFAKSHFSSLSLDQASYLCRQYSEKPYRRKTAKTWRFFDCYDPFPIKGIRDKM